LGDADGADGAKRKNKDGEYLPCAHTCKECEGPFKLGRAGSWKTHMKNDSIHRDCTESCPGFEDVKDALDSKKAHRNITVVLPDIFHTDRKAFFEIAGRSVDVSEDTEIQALIDALWDEYDAAGREHMLREQYIENPMSTDLDDAKSFARRRVYDWVSRRFGFV
jgi:hypothetical protein